LPGNEITMNAKEETMTLRLYAGYYHGRLFRQALEPGGGTR
jgi:hypothetical protein